MQWITKFAIFLHANTTQNRGGVPSVWLSWVMGSGDSWVQVTHPAFLAPPVAASESTTTPLALALAPHWHHHHPMMQSIGECKNVRRQEGYPQAILSGKRWVRLFLFLFFNQIRHDWGESWYDPSPTIFNMKGEPEGPVRISKCQWDFVYCRLDVFTIYGCIMMRCASLLLESAILWMAVARWYLTLASIYIVGYLSL